MSFDKFPDSCTFVKNTNHTNVQITNPLNSLSIEEVYAQKASCWNRLVLYPLRMSSLQLRAIWCIFFQEVRLEAPVSRRNTITWDFQKEQLAKDIFTPLIVKKEKAFGGVHRIPFVSEDISFQNKGRPCSHRVLCVYHCTGFSVNISLANAL